MSWRELLRKPTVGIDIGSASIQIASLVRRREGIVLVKQGSVPTPPDTVMLEDRQIMDNSGIADVLRRLSRGIGIPSDRRAYFSPANVQIKTITLPLMNEEELRALEDPDVLKSFCGDDIPLNRDEYDCQHYMIDPRTSDGRTRIGIVYARKESAREQENVVREAGFRPAEATACAIALYNALEASYASEGVMQGVTMHYHLGVSSCTSNLIVNGKLVYSNDNMGFGTKALIPEILREKPGTDHASLLRTLTNVILGDESLSDSAITGLVSQVPDSLRSLKFWFANNVDIRPDRILVSGAGCLFPQIREAVASQFSEISPKIPIDVMDPLYRIGIDRSLDETAVRHQSPLMALVVGLGLQDG